MYSDKFLLPKNDPGGRELYDRLEYRVRLHRYDEKFVENNWSWNWRKPLVRVLKLVLVFGLRAVRSFERRTQSVTLAR